MFSFAYCNFSGKEYNASRSDMKTFPRRLEFLIHAKDQPEMPDDANAGRKCEFVKL
jgi:hypothetical protein